MALDDRKTQLLLSLSGRVLRSFHSRCPLHDGATIRLFKPQSNSLVCEPIDKASSLREEWYLSGHARFGELSPNAYVTHGRDTGR